MIDHLWLSPHLDDAVLSSGGSIARACARGESVLVVTVCTAPPCQTSPFIDALHKAWRLEAQDVVPFRIDEDDNALATLGDVRTIRLDLLDAVYRRPDDYRDMATLMGPLAEGDDFVDRVAERLAKIAPATSVHAPLAAGGHVDHRAVRAAAERAYPGVRLYEDIPYVLRGTFATEGLIPHETDITLHIEAKIAAIACYASQLSTLFRGDMPGDMRAYHRSADGRFVEREWTTPR